MTDLIGPFSITAPLWFWLLIATAIFFDLLSAAARLFNCYQRFRLKQEIRRAVRLRNRKGVVS